MHVWLDDIYMALHDSMNYQVEFYRKQTAKRIIYFYDIIYYT